MKRFILIVSLVAVFLTGGLKTSLVQAQSYPTRPITLVIPMIAGAAMDAVGRILSEELTKILGKPVIVVNKPGASTTLGTDLVVKSKKDGYTILLANTSSVIYAKISDPSIVPYDSFKDLEPLGLYCFFPFVLAVRQDAPWKTFNELLDYTKKNPGKVRVCTAGQLSTGHFGLEIIQHLTGAQFTHIPKKGNIPLFLLGGNVEALFDTVILTIPHMEAGKMRFLLLSKKMSRYPNVPTVADLGYKQDSPFRLAGLFCSCRSSGRGEKGPGPGHRKSIQESRDKDQAGKDGLYR